MRLITEGVNISRNTTLSRIAASKERPSQAGRGHESRAARPKAWMAGEWKAAWEDINIPKHFSGNYWLNMTDSFPEYD
ncbi:hypothetical protein E2C01_083617 [Portunus trituberculatus]|uniref:Uncharacterized protein n=1 Tax=Portunus trituberculatus TaxID=210409 RepID=A0A5B7J711_PORTR|nr:hypothetical protein [Portunus trituberculatus]